MPESADREAWLAAVRGRLDLPDEVGDEILEELAGHLDDAAADFRDAGLDADAADQRAIRELGDPAELGRRLARARRRGRHVLAAVGGGVYWALADGIRSGVFFALCFLLAAMLALPVAAFVLHALGGSTSSFFGGPFGSAVTVAGVAAWFAWMGRILPARIAPKAMRSVRGVSQAVALAGFVVGSLGVWLVPRLAIDPVLAIGLPLGPVVFAASALRAPDRPRLRLGVGVALGVSLVLVVPLAIVGLLTTTPSEDGGWEAETSAIAAAPTEADGVPFGSVDWTTGVTGGQDWVTVDLSDDQAAAARFVGQFRELRVEVWPATVVDGHMTFGAAPLLVASAPAGPTAMVAWTMPTPKERVSTVTFLVAVGADGRRVLFSGPNQPFDTPPWTGTIADWWFGG